VPDRIRDVAKALDVRVALTGGLTRDLLRLDYGQLSRDEFTTQVHDFDIVVEARNLHGYRAGAIHFAYELVRRLPGKLTLNEAFHTATISTDDGVELDIASSRMEFYPSPGMLPQVDVSGYSIEQDLPRRDFSINAVALELHPTPGALIDPIGGAADIRDGLIRILHSRSFIDDPSRLLRAIRYSVRLNFDLEPVTRDQYRQAVEDGMLDCLSAERVRYELECIGSEPRWVETWGVLDLTEVTDALAKPLGGICRRWSLEDAQALDIALKNQSALLQNDDLPPWLIRTAWVLTDVADEHIETVAARLGLFPKHIRLLRQARSLMHACGYELSGELRPSQIVELLERWPRLSAVTALFIHPTNTDSARMVRRQILRYLDTWSAVDNLLDGHALQELGAVEGPHLGKLQRYLRSQRLDGNITDLDDEVAAAVEWLAQHNQAPGEVDSGDRTGEDEP
jgi:tRNA nucleotidyltransferase (CCA-adding enzyme)